VGAASQAGLAVDLIVGLVATRLTASLPAWEWWGSKTGEPSAYSIRGAQA